MKRRRFIKTGLAAGIGITGGLPGITTKRVDYILKGGFIIDGTGMPGFLGDVAIRDGEIVGIEATLAPIAGQRIDCTGKVVCPGFIDIHSHTDLSLLVNPNAESKIRQGVTTEVTGQDGDSVGPWTPDAFHATKESYQRRYKVDIDFRDLGGFFSRLEKDPGSVNIASMVGAGTVRGTVIGETDRPATDDELKRMQDLVSEALDAGACGLSTGLEYIPGAFANLDELVALCGPVAARNLVYASHMRNEDDRLLAAVEEAIQIGRKAGVAVQISHLKAQGQRNWWKADSVLRAIEDANADGLVVMFDRYPYVAYSTGLTSLFPVSARDGGTGAFLERLADPSNRTSLESAVRDKIDQLGSWNSVQITSASNPALNWTHGKQLGDLASERGEDPFELLVQIMFDDKGRTSMVGFGMSEENTEHFLAHPLGMICSDGGARAPYGPLSEGSPHPRTYGSFPRVLGHYVRDRGIMSLEMAIHKMTGMPAQRLRFGNRGRVRVGDMADLVVFDPESVRDAATFSDPHQYPEGIDHVIVNGTFVIRSGEHTGARPGKVVRPF